MPLSECTILAAAGGDGAGGKGAKGKPEDAGHRNDFGYLYKPLKKGNSLQQNKTISCAAGLRIALSTVARSRQLGPMKQFHVSS